MGEELKLPASEPRASLVRVSPGFQREVQTFGPVPIGLGTVESALPAQSVFKPVDERTVPRQKVPRKMDLVSRSRSAKTPA